MAVLGRVWGVWARRECRIHWALQVKVSWQGTESIWNRTPFCIYVTASVLGLPNRQVWPPCWKAESEVPAEIHPILSRWECMTAVRLMCSLGADCEWWNQLECWRPFRVECSLEALWSMSVYLKTWLINLLRWLLTHQIIQIWFPVMNFPQTSQAESKALSNQTRLLAW